MVDSGDAELVQADFRAEFRTGFRMAVPLTLAGLGFGISFGAVATAAHLGWIAALFMSLTAYSGSAQFASVSIFGTGGGVAAAVVAAVLLNSRYLAIGISVASVVTGNVVRRLLGAQLVVDESWAVSHLGSGRYSYARLLGSGILLYVGWFTGTAIGLLGAGFLGDPTRFGLDVVSPVLFLSLLRGQVRDRRAAAVAVLGVAIALILVPISSPGVPLMAAAAACLVGLVRRDDPRPTRPGAEPALGGGRVAGSGAEPALGGGCGAGEDVR